MSKRVMIQDHTSYCTYLMFSAHSILWPDLQSYKTAPPVLQIDYQAQEIKCLTTSSVDKCGAMDQGGTHVHAPLPVSPTSWEDWREKLEQSYHQIPTSAREPPDKFPALEAHAEPAAERCGVAAHSLRNTSCLQTRSPTVCLPFPCELKVSQTTYDLDTNISSFSCPANLWNRHDVTVKNQPGLNV